MSEFGKVAVLMGGPSSEREISLLSGNAVLGGAARAGASTRTRSIRRSALCSSSKRDGFARVFIALHGRFGEDGTVQGALEVLGIPYTGSGVMASALAMDKWRTKLVWLASGIPTPRYRVVDATTDWWSVVAELGLPLIVKPAREGSTIGITKVANGRSRRAGDRVPLRSAKHDDLVIVEEFVAGIELTVSILGERALPLIRIEAPQGNYDYHHKYFSDETKYLLSVRRGRGGRACDPGAIARCVPDRRLQRLGPARSHPAGGRNVAVPRGEHVARHDRAQPGADGGETGRHRISRSLRRNSAGRACGMTRASSTPSRSPCRLPRSSRSPGARSHGRCASRCSRFATWSSTRRSRARIRRISRRSCARSSRERSSRCSSPMRARRCSVCRGCAASRCAASGRTGSRSRSSEHEPLARWNDNALVNTQGEVFIADYDGELPQFRGPEDASMQVAAGFAEFGRALAPAGLTIARSPAVAARRLAAQGLGRRAPHDRARPQRRERATRAIRRLLPKTIGALARAGTRIDYVDLRYRNGFAARVPALKEKTSRTRPGSGAKDQSAW